MPRAATVRTREEILRQAAQLATVEGIEGLSLAQLAGATGMSKSGLYAHFGSKEELQLATIEAARATFVEEVVKPALAAPKGIQRLIATCEAFISHIEREVFPGGCFFSAAAAEVNTRRGRVRDAVAVQQREWLELLERFGREAQELGELDAAADPGQLAFELNALMVAANTSFILQGDPQAFERCRAAVRRLLGAEPAPDAWPGA